MEHKKKAELIKAGLKAFPRHFPHEMRADAFLKSEQK